MVDSGEISLPDLLTSTFCVLTWLGEWERMGEATQSSPGYSLVRPLIPS